MKMHKRFRDKIKENFVQLVTDIEPGILIEHLLSKKVLKNEEVKKILKDRTDYKHTNRLLLFLILHKNDATYHQFVNSLELFGLKHLFIPSTNTRTITVFHEANTQDEYLPISNLNINNTTESPDLSAATTTADDRTPLVVKVKLSKDFQNTDCDNVYDTRSEKRGQVLIINNSSFNGFHKERRGSQVDLQNLRYLFEQMSMKVEDYEDLTITEMKTVITQFAKFEDDKISDMCIVVIMSHGEERKDELVVIDKHNNGLKVSWIEEQFNNLNCSLFSGKPKIFLYQFCRGSQIDYATTKLPDQSNQNVDVIQTDSKPECNEDAVETDSGQKFQTERRLEDMLIGYPTLKGNRAHRDPYLGSWYIQLICEIFMERSHNTHIIEMLNEVDRRLRLKSSREYTMQTSSYTSNGFNKLLYFNPGIYMDYSGNIQQFF